MTKINQLRLKRDVVQRIRENKEIKLKLCFVLNISQSCLYKWLEDDSANLLSPEFISIISKDLGIEPNNLTENGKSKLARRVGRPKRGVIR